jgi:hypothetical protein
MAPLISAVFHGVDNFKKATHETELRVDKATIGALKENQRILKLAVRRNLRGAPRWNQRGKSSVYNTEYKVMNMGRNEPRSGPPGRFSGILYGGVGGVKRPKKIVGVWIGGVGVGGKLNNFKKSTLEAKYPYFAPAVKATEPKMPAAYEKGWAKAVSKQGGLI